jgi:2-polyprenyl-3-methyl-5-hydroxy-6-metoxy-1,4-benzoquinol methylase
MTIEQNRPDFDSRAAQWDNLQRRVILANAIVEAIKLEVTPQPWMQLLDYGCGTGLVTLGLQPLVKEVIAVDSSRGMLEQLELKAREANISNLHTIFIDLDTEWRLPAGIDLLVSSMTMHHVPDVSSLLVHFKECMNPGAQLCIADLQREDGSFHDDATGIPHKGFAVEEMEGFFLQVGFTAVRTIHVMSVQKERDGMLHEYPVNLTVGRL